MDMTTQLKLNFTVEHQVESFFTGSQILFDSTGDHVYCAFGSTVNKVCIDDGRVKEQITSENEDDIILRIALTPDDNLIFVAYQSGLISKINTQDLVLQRQFKSIHKAPITFLQCNSQSNILATGSSDGTIKLWNLINHYCSHNLKGINGVVSCIKFLDEKNDLARSLLFAAGGDDCIHVYDLSNSTKIAKLSSHCSTVTAFDFCSKQKFLISTSRDKIAIVWDLSIETFGSIVRTIPVYESIESLYILSKEQSKQLIKLDSMKNRTLFATIGEEGCIKFWDTKTGSILLTQGTEPLSSDRSPSQQCFQLTLRPNHNQLCAASYDRNLFFYELPKLDLKQQLQGHIDEVFSACWFGQNNTHLAIASNSQDLKVMELATSKCSHFKGHSDMLLCVKSVPSDPFIVISSSKDCNILIWKFEASSMIPTILFRGTGHTHAIHSLAVLFSKKVFLSGSEDLTVKRWLIDSKPNSDTSEFQPLVASQTIKAHDQRIDALAVSPNDELLATGSKDKTAKIFTVDGLSQVAVLKGHKRGIFALNFSPIDQVIVTASGDSTMKMWNLQDFTCIKTFQGHDCSVLNFTFLTGGLQILSSGSDGNLKLWNCKTTECMKTIDGHQSNIWTLDVTSDESLIVTGAQDGAIKIWKDCTKEEKDAKLASLQEKAFKEVEFSNFLNKNLWKKAFKLAIDLEDSSKTLRVVREILLSIDGKDCLEVVLVTLDKLQINFLLECCCEWTAHTKNSYIGQTVFHLILKSSNNTELLRLPGLTNKLDELYQLTQKSYDRYERLVQDAKFVEFFYGCMKLQ